MAGPHSQLQVPDYACHLHPLQTLSVTDSCMYLHGVAASQPVTYIHHKLTVSQQIVDICHNLAAS